MIRQNIFAKTALLSALFLMAIPSVEASEFSARDLQGMQSSRPQLENEDLPANKRGTPSMGESQIIRDPEREFALQMLAHSEQELRLTEAHAATAIDEQMKQIANDTAATRKKEIATLRAWLATRKVGRTPRMMTPQ